MREMKDSGIEWIGEIPKKWIRTALLNVLRCKICDGPHETPELVDEGIPFISVDSLSDSKFVNLDVTKKYISNELYNEYYKKAPLEKGDVLFSKAATIGKTAIVDNRKFMVWSPLAIIKVDENKCDNTFIYYLLNCESLIQYVSNLGGYNTQINVGMRALEKAQIPVPPCCEQRRIADYLDEKCAKIDAIIEKQQKIIEKLKEYKLSVITETVTKGLNPDAEMKDSGVEWIGEIPNHCCVTRAGHIYNIILGKMLSPNPKDESDTLESYYCAANVHFEGVDNSSLKQMWFSEGEKEQYLVKKDDLLVVEGGAGAGGAAIVKEDDENVYVQNSIMIVRNDNPTLNRWLYYTIYSLVKREYIDLICNKATIPHFTKEKLGNVPVVLFSEDEIEEMVSYLSDKCNSIEKTIHDRENTIEKLKEYKKSLIYEVVTGKREV